MGASPGVNNILVRAAADQLDIVEKINTTWVMSGADPGGLLGFTLGAAAGMLIGKGIQGKKVERQVLHQTYGWEGEVTSTWTENFYSYKHKHAPHWGAAIGGISGAIVGYFLGEKADKEYYIFIPKHIRMQETKSSWFGNYLFGFVVVGTVMGEIAGRTLYTPMSAREGEEKNVGGGRILGRLPRRRNSRNHHDSCFHRESKT